MPKTNPAALEATKEMSARIGAAIRRELTDRGLKQRDLADRTGIDRTTVNKMLTGKLPISMANASLIARALALELSTLTAGDVQPAAKLPSAQPVRDFPAGRSLNSDARGRYVERHRRDLSPKEVDLILGTEFPPTCEVPEDDDFWTAILLAYRAGRLRSL